MFNSEREITHGVAKSCNVTVLPTGDCFCRQANDIDVIIQRHGSS